jgi:hypothetical protein
MADITKEFIDRIISLAPVEHFEIDGRKYTSKSLSSVVPPVVADLTICTLTGLRDYLIANPDGLTYNGLIIHVQNHLNVKLISRLVDEWEQRHEFIHAVHAPKSFPFGNYFKIEDFIINLQTHFVQDETTAAIIALCGNLRQETDVTYTDDGISQEVQAKAGIARVADVRIPNPIELAPYRTFLEINQPASRFVFRLKKTDSGPTAALFEADGGCWTLEAIKRIRDWLKLNVPEEVTIIA